ncbi:peptidyl-prolyl cis-trans isomerase FKBP13, chloroplastic-like [Chenopodium quinoa]|uniref:peptidyl-prolyl cis-trans isomerase FKBP13, chloroplastic-like n=1 Tax=Chenopodium quinoa TaxID=63459 RepID=UPI000B77C398|nr:peptidyl-prolyl cis-trans isomerase FKBP13, chloroplastic-like [Chenopodium quinoa]
MNSMALLSPAFATTKTHNTNTCYQLHKNHTSINKHYEPATRVNAAHPQSALLQTEIDKSNSLQRRQVIAIGTLASILLPSQFAEASCELTTSPSGLAYCDQIVGTGSQAAQGQLIKAHYVGKLENGKVFDSSYNRGKPLTFRVGIGEVIKGWDAGILGSEGVPPMLAGGKRMLMIPPELGYGMRGAGCRGGNCIIPPNSTLFFEVEFLGNVR